MDAEKTINALDQSLAVLIQGTTERGVKLVDWIYLQAPDVLLMRPLMATIMR